MSLVQIVDEADNIIDLKAREEIDYSRDIYRSSILWLTNTKGEVLIAQRKKTKKVDPGVWGPAMAGTLEDNETYEENALKETEEEIGISGFKLKKEHKEYVEDGRKHFFQWFSLVLDEPIEYFTIQEEEVEQIKWIDAQELADDIKNNPQNYVPSMPNVLNSFLKEYV